MAAIADGHILEPPVDHKINQHGNGENAVGDEILLEPIEHRADQRADNDDRQADLRIEILADVEIRSGAYRATVNGAVAANFVADIEPHLFSTSTTSDQRLRIGGVHRQTGVALRTLRDDFHRLPDC